MTQREIKFRAWDKVGKTMQSVHSLEMPLLGDMGKVVCDTGMVLRVTTRGVVELMQFTGLLDKNGKDIYEGDILKDGEDGNQYNGRLGVVEYVTNNSEGQPINGYWYRVSPDEAGTIYTKRVEIIGNIYSNPELIQIT